jgi:hypothetical protein
MVDEKLKLPATAKELIAAHESLDDKTFLWAMARLPDHEKDLLIECPNKMCKAAEGKECKGTNRLDRRKLDAPGAKYQVHIARRVRRLLKGIR